MKRYLSTAALIVTMTIGLATVAARSEASTIASYVASGDPGFGAGCERAIGRTFGQIHKAPTGGRGSGFFSPFSLSATPWVLFTYPGPDVGSIQSSHTFDGGPLASRAIGSHRLG